MVDTTTVSAPEPSAPLPAIPARRRVADPFLIGILAALALLVLVAVVTVFVVLQQPVRELPANTPGGVVQRYFAALEKQNYDEAYGYLSGTMKEKPTRADFIQARMNSRSYGSSSRIRITRENVYGDQASVELTTTSYYQSNFPLPSTNEWTSTSTISLVRENGQWRINDLPYMY
ncbi:MAG TPA: NTF2-like N-terminal transpeptidase domain-containing protein [Chloroflexia bacterium]|jgi:hypothetical protein